MKERARVVIIGGGVGGCSLAYHLAEVGWADDVVLLEKGELTSGSTWHAAGLTTQYSPSRNHQRLQMYSVDLFKRLESLTGQAVDFHEVGSIRLAQLPERLDEYKRTVSRAATIGLECEILSPAEIGERWPIINTDGLRGGLYIPNEGFVDPASVANGMAAGAKAKGVEINRRTRVTAVTELPDGSWLVATDRGDIACEILVNAAGMWAPRIGRMAGVELPIAPLQHHMIVTGPIDEVKALPTELPVIRDVDGSFYVRQEVDSLIIGTFEEHTRTWAVDEGVPWDFEGKLLEPDLDRIQEYLMRAGERIPISAEAGIQRFVNGPDGYTPDGKCLMGWTPGSRTFFQLCGFSIMGIMVSGGAGKLAAEWIVDGQPEWDVWELDVRRFGPWAGDRRFLEARTLDVYGYEYGISFPHDERPAGRPVRTDPLHEALLGKGAVMGFRGGWERPLWFAPAGAEEDSRTFRTPGWVEHVARECRSVRNGVGVLDQTSFAKYRVSGPAAHGFLENLCANRVSEETGKVVVTQMLTERGGIECDLTVTKTEEAAWYVVGAAATEVHDLEWMVRHAPDDGGVTIENVTSDRGVLTVAGSRSRELLARLTDSDLTNALFPWMSARDIRVAGAPAFAMRVSFIGELGWELHLPMEHVAAVYDALFEAGGDLGIVDFGYRALDSMRIEKGYHLWGSDMNPEYSPLEAGLDAFVKFDKEFIGRGALERQKAEGLTRTHACMTVDCGDAIPLGYEAVRRADDVIGYVTSAERGHTVGKVIALAYLPPEHVVPGTQLTIEVLGERRAAQVVKAPLFDPAGERLRA